MSDCSTLSDLVPNSLSIIWPLCGPMYDESHQLQMMPSLMVVTAETYDSSTKFFNFYLCQMCGELLALSGCHKRDMTSV